MLSQTRMAGMRPTSPHSPGRSAPHGLGKNTAEAGLQGGWGDGI